jgi:hypothetical protein
MRRVDHDYIQDAVVLPKGETRLEMMRRVIAPPPPDDSAQAPTATSIARAISAGRQEAMEAARRTGRDFTAEYDDMCRRLARLVN